MNIVQIHSLKIVFIFFFKKNVGQLIKFHLTILHIYSGQLLYYLVNYSIPVFTFTYVHFYNIYFTHVHLYIIHVYRCQFLHYSHLHLSISTLFTFTLVHFYIIHIYTCPFLHYSHLHLVISTLFTFTLSHFYIIHIYTQ